VKRRVEVDFYVSFPTIIEDSQKNKHANPPF
jgi:hypothetical protein